MREDQLEILEKMFPEGFILFRVDEARQIRMTVINKQDNHNLALYTALLLFLTEKGK